MTDINRITAQMKREKDSQQAGYDRFLRNEKEQTRLNDGSNTSWSISTKRVLLGEIIAFLENEIANPPRKGSTAIHNLRLCTGVAIKRKKGEDGQYHLDEEVKTRSYWDLPTAAFMGLQMALDAALNPNQVNSKIISRNGVEKNLAQKPTVSQLETRIGQKIQDQITYTMMEKNFPSWFARTNKEASLKDNDGLKADTRYWEYRVSKSKDEFIEYLRLNGRDTEADLLCWKPWSYNQSVDVGAWILRGVILGSGLFVVKSGYRDGKRADFLELSDTAAQHRQQWIEDAEQYCADLLPMLVTPCAPTSDNMGGWLTPSLHAPAPSFKGTIELSDEQLGFIRSQQEVPFRVSAFTYQLLSELNERGWHLGKFKPHYYQEPASVSSRLGADHIMDDEARDAYIRNHPDFKQACVDRSRELNIEGKRAMKGIGSIQLLNKLRKISEDDQFFIPVSWDMRGRIYSRVPFASFQYSDPGRYALEFAHPTPIDSRTKFWLSVGIANAAGQDKKPFDTRVSWVEKNIRDVIIVGNMLTDDGDFAEAYRILTEDNIDDPFAFARLCHEYVELFIRKSRAFTHCFVCVDASASGTQFHSAWRQNKHGAVQCNLTNSPEPQDIYLSVWNEIKALSLHSTKGNLHPTKLKKLRLAGKDRSLVKKGYVPYSYGCGIDRVKEELSLFNADLDQSLQLTETELDIVIEVWEAALDRVASVGSTVGWFKARTEEALKAGKKTIKFTNALGSVMELKYPKTKETRVKTFHHGQAGYRELKEYEPTDEPNAAKLIMAVAANVTHCCDAALLASTLSGSDFSFISIHDSVGVAPGATTDRLIANLKESFIRVASQDVWTQFLEDNGLDKEDHTLSAPIVGDWDINDVRGATYMFA
jgi:DNA-directed RNA polymerase